MTQNQFNSEYLETFKQFKATMAQLRAKEEVLNQLTSKRDKFLALWVSNGKKIHYTLAMKIKAQIALVERELDAIDKRGNIARYDLSRLENTYAYWYRVLCESGLAS